MADTKISALSATPSVTTADIVPVIQSSTSKNATLGVIKTLVNTGPTFTAGNSSAGTWPVLTSGSVLSVPVDGTLEHEGNAMFFTGAASSRGVVVAEQIITNNSAYTLSNVTTAQKIFNNPANGAIAVSASTSYFFEMSVNISGMTATSGNCGVDLLGAGTATFTSSGWYSIGMDASTLSTAGANGGAYQANSSSVGNVVTAATGTAVNFMAKGIIRINAAGTIIPSVKITTASATAVVGLNSWFKINPIGTNTVVSIGHWS